MRHILLNRIGVIPLARRVMSALRVRCSGEAPHEPRQLNQILSPQRRSAGGHDDERVGRNHIRPARRQRNKPTTLVVEVHTVLTPVPAASHEHELTAMPRVKRMSHPNTLRLIGTIRCT